MRLFGLTVTRQQAATAEKALAPAPQRDGWWGLIRESFAGAWQQNVEVKLDSVLTNHAVRSCISRIAADVSKLRIRLVEKDDNGIWVEKDAPAFSPVLRKPNNYQNRIQFFRSWVISKLVHGNTYVLKERDARGIVTALHVLDPMQVKPLVSTEGDVFYEICRDHLAGVEMDSLVVPAREIIHDRGDTLYHPLVGVSPIQASGLAATQGLKIQNNSTNFFGNGARPGGVLTAPDQISPETAARLKEYWDNNFSGANAGKVAVLGDGLRYEAMMMKATDAQMIEQLKWTAETVCSTFHVPAFMVGIGETPAYNNVQALNQQYYSQCLQEHIEGIELALDEGLELPKQYGTEFDLDDLLRMDTVALVDALSEATKAGLMAPDEGRKRLNLGPVPGGKFPYLQVQNYSLEALSKRDNSELLPPPEPVAQIEDQTERAIAAVRMKFAEAIHA